jgi:hypothetical protein
MAQASTDHTIASLLWEAGKACLPETRKTKPRDFGPNQTKVGGRAAGPDDDGGGPDTTMTEGAAVMGTHTRRVRDQFRNLLYVLYAWVFC